MREQYRLLTDQELMKQKFHKERSLAVEEEKFAPPGEEQGIHFKPLGFQKYNSAFKIYEK